MSNLGGLIYVVLAVGSAITAVGTSLGVGACLVGMMSRRPIVRRWIAGLISAAMSVPLVAAGAYGTFYLASFNGIGFAAQFGVWFAAGGATIVGLAAGFLTGRLFSRPQDAEQP
jgi:hypothetical protein